LTLQQFRAKGYLERIGYRGETAPNLGTLEALQSAHLDRIPFENLDVRLGRPVGLDLETLVAKLVDRRRGGYCFEQNTLFAAALRTFGFAVETLEARVRPPGATSTLPRTHMLLRVQLEDRGWLADVGFGGDGPLLPVPLDGAVSEQGDAGYRVVTEDSGHGVLRRRWRDSWHDLYAFSLSPALPVDFEVAHYFTSTHPESIFVRTLTVQRSEPETRHILRGRTYTMRRGEEETQREVADDELPGLLAERFGLEVPAADVIRALGSREADQAANRGR